MITNIIILTILFIGYVLYLHFTLKVSNMDKRIKSLEKEKEKYSSYLEEEINLFGRNKEN